MTFKINGTTLTIQPSTHRWIPREPLGINGNGIPRYPSVREYELKWDITSPSEFNQLQTFFNAIGYTGTAVVDLPRYGASTYTFFAYSGCVLYEPQMEGYFEGYYQNVYLMVTNIRT